MGIVVGALTALVALVVLGGRALLGVHTVAPGAKPLALPERSFPHDAWGVVLRRYVHDAGVDYEGLVANPTKLRRYTATLAEVGPRTAPDRFPTRRHRLAYYLNAYNALVLLGVVTHWPVQSVHDVRGPLEPEPGLGFFWAQRFHLDGDTTHLHALENDMLRSFGDARIHAALNCASASCPPLRKEPFKAARVVQQLDDATRAFCSQPPYLEIRDEARVISLSPIFDWYRSDFQGHARRLDVGRTVLDFVIHFAEPDVAKRLRRVRGDYEVRYRDYDWSLNAASR